MPEAHLQVKQRPELLTRATLAGSSMLGGHSRFLYSKDWELSGFPFMCLWSLSVFFFIACYSWPQTFSWYRKPGMPCLESGHFYTPVYTEGLVTLSLGTDLC